MIDGLSSSKFALRQYLLHLGYLFGVPPEAVADRLNRHMGPVRATKYKRLLSDQSMAGEDRENAIYDFFTDLMEANLFRSLSTDVTLDTCYALYEKASPFLIPGARVLELACWTGGFSSFLAEQHPACTVTGVDRVSKMVDICNTLYGSTNLSFLQWDYRHRKPTALQPAEVLLCSLGTNNNCPREVYFSFDSTSVRSTTGYSCEKKEAHRYFKRWRLAAKPCAVLFAVLRVFTFPRFLAFIDAAQETGWKPLLDECTAVHCTGNREHIPFFSFRAERAAVVDEDVALSHFTKLMNTTDHWETVHGPVAMGVYRSLGNRSVLATKEVRDNAGLPVVVEYGICGSLGYVYRHDTCPNVDLTIFPRTVVQDLVGGSMQPATEPVGIR